jgi:steroid 5-alpha reductase family enzyme
MNFLAVWGTGAIVIVGCMLVLWLVSLRQKDASITDIFWGPGFVVLAGVYFLFTTGDASRKFLLVVLVAVWGIRLAIHIGARNLGKGEDKRYQAFRAAGGSRYWWISFFQVFMLQAVLMLIISAPLLAAEISPQPDHLTFLDMFGAGVWIVGFAFEAIGDWQLAQFKADPGNKGEVMDRGLWRYTRHPNYFGEAVLWWGYYVIAVSTPSGLWTVFSPLLMTLLLVWVSGMRLLEKTMSETRPGYAQYIQTTRAFLPWFPRRDKGSEISSGG